MKLLKIIIKKILSLLVLTIGKKRYPKDIRRIIVISAGYLGDTFWAWQTLSTLREKFPLSEIIVITHPFCAPLFVKIIAPENILTTAVIVRDRQREKVSWWALWQTAKKFRATKPDLVIDLMNNRYSAFLAFILGAYSLGENNHELSPLYSRAINVPRENFHLALRPQYLVSIFCNLPPPSIVKLSPPNSPYSSEEITKRIDLPKDKKIALIISGAGWESKKWAIENFMVVAEFLLQHNFAVMVSGNDHDINEWENFASKNQLIIINDLALAISLLPFCALCIGNDTGLTHIAATIIPHCLSLYCATNPALAKTASEIALTTTCAQKPTLTQHCTNFPSRLCHRAEFMNITPPTIIASIEHAVLRK